MNGVRLAIDWGQARIGVAACDRDGLLAFPVETVPARDRPIERLRALVSEYEPIEVIVGLPSHLSGREGSAAASIRERATELAAAIAPVPVCLTDERLSTVEASRNLSAAGRRARAQRTVIDQAAAVAILNQALDRIRAGVAPGEYLAAEPKGEL